MMKAQTNLYARQKIDKVKKSNVCVTARSKINTWKSVQIHEVYNFLAIIVHMSVVHKPRISDYWAKRPFLQTTFPSRIMKRDRFLDILANFHLNDDSAAVPKGEPGYDPLHKLRPFINHLNHLFQTSYIPEQHIIIDEALCPWRGKLSFKVYMKDKPVKWGIKLYHLCESKSGYVWWFEILCGMPGLSNRPYDVVQRLLGPLKSLGYCLYTDTYYTSLALAEDLASSNTGFTGTVLSNIIGLPKEFMNTKLDTGGVDFRRCKNTVVLRWKDKTDVAVLSTIHRPQMVAVNTRTSVKKRPTAIVDYHKNMGGVDLNDHMISYNAFYRKTTKWWKKLAFHMLTLTMVQAHCLYLKLFQTTYIPEQHIIIDEALCPWRGKLSFKVYMKDKPVKWGIKIVPSLRKQVWYVWRFEILCGMPGLSNRPYDVVQRLLGPLKSLGYCLYTDTYYTSLALAEDLASSNTGFTGTVLSNRIGLPKEFMNTKLDTGGVDFRRCKNTVVLRWKDKTDVAVLSTIHRPQMVAVNTCTSVKKRPTAIVDYHKNMGGVDLNDHMISYNAFYRKTTKWWKKLAFHMLTLTMVQAHCLYLKVRKIIGKPGMCLEDFMISVGEDLVTMPKSDLEQPTGAAVPQDPQQLRLQGKHLSHFLVPLKVRRYCCVCYARLKAEGTDSKYRRKRTQRTKWECQQCKKALCVHPCMKAYHTMQDYTRPLQNLV
ncbi:piggyBac transposable element-derived protein 4-like [Pomacea canaliculata]|uniref:piggyBac transposable element-derived protein 4-like n=1 Tax=Pomacea canaliculata TaxID=400727 RepID=UPI000D73974D|nr:piggyBac transposable element-derived protein 4-like [Pomacea canaliculata]